MEASLRDFAIVEINNYNFQQNYYDPDENSWISMKINKHANHPKYLPGKHFHRNRTAQSYIPALQGEIIFLKFKISKIVFRHYL